jgi:hypothetical protein
MSAATTYCVSQQAVALRVLLIHRTSCCLPQLLTDPEHKRRAQCVAASG